MHQLIVGHTTYRIRVARHAAGWSAQAERADSGERFGAECGGRTEMEAVERLTAWLRWQHDHEAALEALQLAERTYHRILAASAFVSPGEGGTAVEAQRESLDEVEKARRQLDAIRASHPPHA